MAEDEATQVEDDDPRSWTGPAEDIVEAPEDLGAPAEPLDYTP